MVARAVPYSCAATSEPRIRHVSEPVRHSGDQKPETIRDQEREGEGALPSVRGCTGEQRGLAARERRPNTQRARDDWARWQIASLSSLPTASPGQDEGRHRAELGDLQRRREDSSRQLWTRLADIALALRSSCHLR
jgi:hypothetical protein